MSSSSSSSSLKKNVVRSFDHIRSFVFLFLYDFHSIPIGKNNVPPDTKTLCIFSFFFFFKILLLLLLFRPHKHKHKQKNKNKNNALKDIPLLYHRESFYLRTFSLSLVLIAERFAELFVPPFFKLFQLFQKLLGKKNPRYSGTISFQFFTN